MKLSIIVPVYNEKNTIQEILHRIRKQPIDKEIIVVDDCSQDGTREILIEEGKKDDTIAFFHSQNMGKGYAIRTGLAEASGDIILIQDGDLEYDPNDYEKLIEPIIQNSAKVVYGSRRLGRKPNISYHRYYFGGVLLTWLTNLLYGSNITDEATCYKVFKTDVIKNIQLKAKRFEFCPEVTAKILKKGYNIHEVSVSYYPRDFRGGKKIGVRDGLIAIYSLVKYRFFAD